MAEIHCATSDPLAKELVEDAVAFVREHALYAVNQAATLHSDDPRAAADSAVYEVWTEMLDHLQIKFSMTLASWRLREVGE